MPIFRPENDLAANYLTTNTQTLHSHENVLPKIKNPAGFKIFRHK